MSRPISAQLEIRETDAGERIACRACGHALAPAGEPWKRHAALSEIPMHGAGGTAYTGDREALLRRFACPGCGALLDSEMALPGEPFLDDIVHA
jgi:acetone carboxylase gamma subunit